MFLSLGNLELELCYQPSFTHNSVTHRHLCHTPSVLRGRLRFAWQAWHLATSTFVSRGRCGTWSHSPSFRVAGVALMALGFVLRGRRGAYGTGLALVARLSALGHAWSPVTPKLCVAGVALGDIHFRFAWQVWHLVTFTFVSCGRRGTYGTGLRFAWQAWPLWHWAGSSGAWARWGALGHWWRRPTLRGRLGTWRHPPSFRVAGVAVSILTHRGKKSDAKQMTLERWREKKSAVMPHVSA